MKKVHHMVLLKFKSPDGAARAADLLTALAELQKSLSGIVHLSGGPYASPEGLNQGFTHGFLMTFAHAQARDHYLTHPEHEQVKQRFLPHLENVLAFDFEE